ncbi:cytochrome P450 4c3 isoform X2 [Zootermopsis nevadensis]|uniref:cytochrome P450 4c3 isoform X2 n=1 Tax=Zootermopsis nevadensis TaxID=136037 RepID=UPI000B8E4A14|nr:cytochrome P450 4c3 isoform X2 [Zootermopsis nevadensis]XP_021922018.1 cytochrome P450 4c3 isoform X2 [Zootermopsis nevadensis]
MQHAHGGEMWDLSLLSAVVVVLLVYVLVAWHRYQKRRARMVRLIDRIPGPPSLPLIGNTIELNVEHDELLERLMGSTKLWGRRVGVNRMWNGTKPYITVFHPDRVEPILSSNKHIDKSKDYSYLHPWLGTGLLTSSGSKWHSRRKILTPAFHFKILEDFIDVFLEQSSILVKKLEREIGNEAGFNIFPYITHCALDVICETAMGRQVNAQGDSQSEYVKAVYEIGSIIQNRQSKLWLQPDWMFRWTHMYKTHEKCIKILHGFSNKVIQERKEEFAKLREKNKMASTVSDEDTNTFGRKKRLAFLDLLIEASRDGAVLSNEDIREEVDTFMFEGHDTTSAAISWALFLLGGQPDIQTKVIQEIDGILGPGAEQGITMKDLNEMKYLECCIKEALRLYPSVPIIARQINEDINMAHYTVPAGTTALIITYMLHRNPESFPQPEQFNPDRFLKENVIGRHPYAYIPFSAGPRNCIGQKFALLEEKAVIASILRKYRVEAVDRRENLTLLGELILRPKHGLRIKIFPRYAKSDTGFLGVFQKHYRAQQLRILSLFLRFTNVLKINVLKYIFKH